MTKFRDILETKDEYKLNLSRIKKKTKDLDPVKDKERIMKIIDVNIRPDIKDRILKDLGLNESNPVNEGIEFIEVNIGKARKAKEALHDELRGTFKTQGSNYFVFKRSDDAYAALETLRRWGLKADDIEDTSMDDYGDMFESKPLEEGVSNDAKAFMKTFNEYSKYLKDDIKNSDTNEDWYGRIESIGLLIKKTLDKR